MTYLINYFPSKMAPFLCISSRKIPSNHSKCCRLLSFFRRVKKWHLFLRFSSRKFASNHSKCRRPWPFFRPVKNGSFFSVFRAEIFRQPLPNVKRLWPFPLFKNSSFSWWLFLSFSSKIFRQTTPNVDGFGISFSWSKMATFPPFFEQKISVKPLQKQLNQQTQYYYNQGSFGTKLCCIGLFFIRFVLGRRMRACFLA